MSQNDIWYAVLGALAAAGVLSAVISFLYYRSRILRMSRMLRRYQDSGWEAESIAETRESKLEAQLRKILRQSLQQKEQAKKDRQNLAGLLSDLSHQLKTPLSGVVMDAELLQDPSLTQEERLAFAGHIGTQARKMQWLIAALVKTSRLENGILQFTAKEQGIRQTLAESVSTVYAKAQEKGISVELLEDGDIRLYHNRKWTSEAVTNILENAVKYSPCGSTVRITVQRLEIYTKISIRDEGPGVPKEEYNKIFQRFYRGSGTEEEAGTGLGLYLAQVILAQEKGYITCESEPDGGSCFSVFLLNRAPSG